MPLVRRRDFLAGAAATAVLRADTTPAWQTSLNNWKGVRPRILMDAKKLATIRGGLDTTYSAMWNRLPFQTSIIRSTTPPSYTVVGSTDPQLWQRDNGASMIYLAFAYLLSGDKSYLTDCQKWIQASCSYPTWGTGSMLNNDLAAAHQLLGLAVVYDWLQGSLDSATLSTIRQTLISRAPVMYAASLDPKVSWQPKLLANQPAICMNGLTAAGLALFDDPAVTTQALQWIDRARQKMSDVDGALQPDGASLEGVTYWDYGMEYGLMFWANSEALLGEKVLSPSYSNMPFYRLYLTVPYNTWFFQNPMQMDLSDCARIEWEGPSPHIRRIGAMVRNPYAQWFADNIAAKGVDRYIDAWLNFLWYDPSLPVQNPAGLPTMRHFDDMEIVSARSDWSGSESIVVLKCGPPCGLNAMTKLKIDSSDGGHAHPDANHFLIFGNNEFLVRDDGYLDVKYSRNHNTLLVNSQGQMGEGQQFLTQAPYLGLKSYAGILTAESAGNLDYIVGEAAPAYSASQGVRQFTRHLLFIKPNVLVVFDDIQLNQSAPMELRFHTETAPTSAGGSVFTTQGANGSLRTEVLVNDSSLVSLGSDPVSDHGTNFNLNYVRLQKTAISWRNATAFSWAAKTPTSVTVQPTQAGYTVAVGARRISFQWDRTPAVESTIVPALRNAQPVLPAFGGNPANGFTANGYIEIYGNGLANTTTLWSGSDFNGNTAPQSLAGTEVKVNGIPAFVYFVSPNRVNVNLPQDATIGPVELQVFNNGAPSNIVTINRAAVSPAMLTTPTFLVNGKQYVVALLPSSTQDGPFVGPANLIPGVAFQPVRAGDRIVLYVLGAGPTTPATQAGVTAGAASKVSSSYTLRIGGQIATVEFFGIVAGSIGLYQLNAIVPQLPSGDQPIELTVAGVNDHQNLFIAGIAP